jgi:ribulose-5-phosphate 4-epimerase/fuculose-1-phosphate aldolase
MVADLQRLTEVSQRLGHEVGYIQGGGGNTSIKIDANTMYIKASGRNLAGISPETGFLPLNWKLVKTSVVQCRTEQDYSDLLTASSLSEDASVRPSIETGFHALLGRCVLHSHSVWANILTCSKEGEDIVTKLFPSALWVPYFTPGLHLTKAIAGALGTETPDIIFLQNHGLIVCADDEHSAFTLHEGVNGAIRRHFGEPLPFPVGKLSIPAEMKRGLLFPDQAVYHSNALLAESPAGRETMQACDFLLHNIQGLGLTINFIDEIEKNTLINLESEKYRQKVAGA